MPVSRKKQEVTTFMMLVTSAIYLWLFPGVVKFAIKIGEVTDSNIAFLFLATVMTIIATCMVGFQFRTVDVYTNYYGEKQNVIGVVAFALTTLYFIWSA